MKQEENALLHLDDSHDDPPLAPEGSPPRTSDSPIFPKPLAFRPLIPALLIALAGLALIPWANPVYHVIFQFLRRLPLKSFFASSVQFPSAMVVVMILAVIFIYQRHRRPTIVVFLIALLLSSGVNNTIKVFTGRARPRYSIAMGHKEKNWVRDYVARHPGAGMTTVRADQWLGPANARQDFLLDEYQSFPSGHANSSFVMAAWLCALYPEARLVWFAAAGGCALARVEKSRHWPEDVLFGGALGWLISQLVFSWRWPLRLGVWLLGSRWVSLTSWLAGWRHRRKARLGEPIPATTATPDPQET